MGHINYAPLLFSKQMLRRNFLKKILISTISIIAMSNKLFAKEMFSKPIFKDGIFYNNYIDHNMASFKDFWKWRKESTKPDRLSFPLAKNNPKFLLNNNVNANIYETFISKEEKRKQLFDFTGTATRCNRT